MQREPFGSRSNGEFKSILPFPDSEGSRPDQGQREYGWSVDQDRAGGCKIPSASFFAPIPSPKLSVPPFQRNWRGLDSLTQALRSRGRNLGTRLRKRARVGLRFTESASPTVLHRKTVNQEKVERLAPYETEESGNSNPSFLDQKSGKASGFTTETVANRETETIRRVPAERSLERVKGRSDSSSRESLPVNRYQAPQARNQRSPLGLPEPARCHNPRFNRLIGRCASSGPLLDKGRIDMPRVARPIGESQGTIPHLAKNWETQPAMPAPPAQMAQEKTSRGQKVPKTPGQKNDKADSQNREGMQAAQTEELALVYSDGSGTSTSNHGTAIRCVKCGVNEAFWSSTWCRECLDAYLDE